MNTNIVQPDAFATNFLDSLERSIATSEGLGLKLYQINGLWHIGYGRNLDAVGISKAEAKFLLDSDCAKAINNLTTYYHFAFRGYMYPRNWYNKLDNVRKLVLVEMCFNMGFAGLMEFQHMIAEIEAGEFENAAVEMLSSLWATQVGKRAVTLAAMMRTGQIPADHLAAMGEIEW